MNQICLELLMATILLEFGSINLKYLPSFIMASMAILLHQIKTKI
jgi:hypothetical protein